MADPEIMKERDNVSLAQSSFIANAHSELHAFYIGKGDLLKILRPKGERPNAPPL